MFLWSLETQAAANQPSCLSMAHPPPRIFIADQLSIHLQPLLHVPHRVRSAARRLHSAQAHLRDIPLPSRCK